LTGLTGHCATGATCGSAHSSASRSIRGSARCAVLMPLASRFRSPHAFVDILLGHAGSNPD
jgi:hypothetical protein